MQFEMMAAGLAGAHVSRTSRPPVLRVTSARAGVPRALRGVDVLSRERCTSRHVYLTRVLKYQAKSIVHGRSEDFHRALEPELPLRDNNIVFGNERRRNGAAGGKGESEGARRTMLRK